MRFACLVALLCASPAAAGELPFTYTIADSAGRLLESRVPTFADPDNSLYAVENPIYLGNVDYQLPATFIPGDRSQSYYIDRERVEGTLTITDRASGVSGQVPLWYEELSDYEVRSPEDTYAHATFQQHGPDTDSPATLTLGNARYTVYSRDPSVLNIELSAAPVSAQTPEPASVALAGLGLAAVGLRRRWRG